MYCNFLLVDKEFINKLSPKVGAVVKDFVYKMYLGCGKKTTEKVSKDQYFSSTHIKYKFVYSYCPKCKKSGFLLSPFKKASLHELKFCGVCGESNIGYRYIVGFKDAEDLLRISEMLYSMGQKVSSNTINKQIIVLINTIMEAYLRDFYAGILNTKFVNNGYTLFDKFAKECRNDFQSCSKAQQRLKKDLDLDLKKIIGNTLFKKIDELSAFRNVIAHNNGICDQQFIDRKIGSYTLHEKINLSTEEVRILLKTLNDSVLILDNIYQENIEKQIFSDLENKVLTNSEDAFTVFILPSIKIVKRAQKGTKIHNCLVV